MTSNEIIKFSLWADYIDKTFIETKLKELIASGKVTGATSNPTIFKDAFKDKKKYKKELDQVADKTTYEKYEHLAIGEIKRAAKAFREIYETSGHQDGYVSIEIDPFLANDTQKSIIEGKRLFAAINEPNVMIKVPATEAGYGVMAELLNSNIAVNATLIFSPVQAKAILNAVSSLKDKTKPIVLSVFVSRFDRLLNDKLPKNMKNLTGIMNAALIYDEVLRSKISNARTLFASTGVKSEQKLEKDYYIAKLLAPNSINTAPIDSIDAFDINSIQNISMPISKSKILGFFESLKEYADINSVYDELLTDALVQFEKSFTELLASLES